MSRVRPRRYISEVYQPPPRCIYNGIAICRLQPVETRKHGDDFSLRTKQLLCISGPDDRNHDRIVSRGPPEKNQSRGSISVSEFEEKYLLV